MNELNGMSSWAVKLSQLLRKSLPKKPTGALDSKTSVEVMSLLKELNSTENMTILVVTHEAGVANETNKIVHIKDGLIGEIEENLDHHANRGFK